MEFAHLWDLFLAILRPVFEIGIITFLIYKVLYFMRGTRGAYVLAGLITVLLALSILSDLLKLAVISWLINAFWGILSMTIIVIFQPELRRAFAQLGTYTMLRGKRQREVIGEIVNATVNMSKRKCGAIMVIERRIGMRALEEDSVRLDIKVNAMILESIFYPNSPLHDGAVIIRHNRIVAARVILPLTRANADISQRLGTRHRAAVGISEETDAVVVVVSEETGIISVCCRGVLKRNLPPHKLEPFLEKLIITDNDDMEPAMRDILDSDDEESSGVVADALDNESSGEEKR